MKIYENEKPIHQKLQLVNPQKEATIKAKVEKLLKAGFIYLVPLIECLSNTVPVDKKQGTIRVYINIRNSNKAFPKYNYPTPFIDKIVDDCTSNDFFCPWTDSPVTIKLLSIQRISTRQPYLSLGKVCVQKDSFWSKKCWIYFSGAHVL